MSCTLLGIADDRALGGSLRVIVTRPESLRAAKAAVDGVVGAIDKLERLGGCIIADSVGLGKTFEALAIIKYYELRNDRVLVLVPKRLRDNWTLYKANDRRNFLASDRFNYDVLNHTDLSRDGGTSGDIDLAHVNWGNYDLRIAQGNNDETVASIRNVRGVITQDKEGSPVWQFQIECQGNRSGPPSTAPGATGRADRSGAAARSR